MSAFTRRTSVGVKLLAFWSCHLWLLLLLLLLLAQSLPSQKKRSCGCCDALVRLFRHLRMLVRLASFRCFLICFSFPFSLLFCSFFFFEFILPGTGHERAPLANSASEVARLFDGYTSRNVNQFRAGANMDDT